MKTPAERFQADGYLVMTEAISESEMVEIESHLSLDPPDGAGTRNVLNAGWCRQLAERLKRVPTLQEILPPNPVAAQCTYFHKSDAQNWLVPLHRDLSIPVRAWVDSPDWSAWSQKEGVIYAHPPEAVLESVVAVRLHFEENHEGNSPLQVVPGSHAGLGYPAKRINCLVPRGGALAMRPLILHSSTKLQKGTRRVLHFVFGPRFLPNKAEWALAV